MKTISDTLIVMGVLKIFGLAPFIGIGWFPIIGFWLANFIVMFIGALIVELLKATK